MIPLDVWRTVCREYVTAPECLLLCKILNIPLPLSTTLLQIECDFVLRHPEARPVLLRTIAHTVAHVKPPGVRIVLKNYSALPDYMFAVMVFQGLLRYVGNYMRRPNSHWFIHTETNALSLVFHYDSHLGTELPCVVLDLLTHI